MRMGAGRNWIKTILLVSIVTTKTKTLGDDNGVYAGQTSLDCGFSQ
jgi:hypothetical protein